MKQAEKNWNDLKNIDMLSELNVLKNLQPNF